MFKLQATSLAIHFHKKRLFSPISLTLSQGQAIAVIGPNGSGKTSLLRAFCGQLRPQEGTLSWFHQDKPIEPEDLYKYLSWAGPYMDLFAELTLAQQLKLHFSLKPCVFKEPVRDCAEALRLTEHLSKPLKHFSSGMLHRLKMGMAIFTDTPLLVLDEPTATLDETQKNNLLNLIQAYRNDRCLILASNIEDEYKHFDCLELRGD